MANLFRHSRGLSVQTAKPVIHCQKVGRRFAQQYADSLNPDGDSADALFGLLGLL